MIAIEPGIVISGRYRLERELGAGGMGVVWAAREVTTGEHVALKLLREADDDASSRRRFMREARAAAAVRHPHVVTVHDVLLLDDGTPVIVMELLEGEALSTKLRREKRLSIEALAPILLPVVSAVGTAHTLGIVHRDIKPDNIFLSREGEKEVVKVVDFGIAKLTIDGDGEKTGGMTTTGTMLGTPFYMSPEQAFGEKDVDYRSDIWSLGILIYKCLAGAVPTYADNVGQILKIILSDKIPLLSEKAPGTPEDVVMLVRKMLQVERTERPKDLREVFGVFAKYAPGMSVPAFGDAIIPPPRSSSKLLQAGSDGRMKTAADTIEDRDTVRAEELARGRGRTRRILPASSSGVSGSPPALSETSVGVQVADPRSVNISRGLGWPTRIAVAAGILAAVAGVSLMALRAAHPRDAGSAVSAGPPPLATSSVVIAPSASAVAAAASAEAAPAVDVAPAPSAKPVATATATAKKVKPAAVVATAATPTATPTATAAAPNANVNNGKFVEKPPF